MALTRLLPLLASLQMLPRPVSPADPPPAPRLYVDTRYTVYLPGERVKLMCSAPQNEDVWGFRFFYQKGQQDPELVQLPSGRTWLEFTAEKGHTGSYTCAYSIQESSQQIWSRNSSSVSLTVTDIPAPSTLSLSRPYQLYLTGESVVFTCSAPPGDHNVTGFQFSKVSGETISSGNSNTHILSSVTQADSGSYTCAYEVEMSGRRLKSGASPAVLINVTDRPPPPSLSLDPPCLEYLLGEQVTLSCVDPKVGEVTGYRFYNERSGEISTNAPDSSGGAKLVFLALHMADAGRYTCKYWRAQSEQEILSVGSQPVSVSVLDPPSQPALSMDPPTGVIKEGLPLLITCTAPRDTGERRFHFYKDGAEFILGNTRSQISTSEPGTDSRNVSVLRIPRASPDSTGTFTCGYEEKVCRKWVPSPRSQAVNITVTADKDFLLWFLVVGGSFFVINGLIFLISHCCL